MSRTDWIGVALIVISMSLIIAAMFGILEWLGL